MWRINAAHPNPYGERLDLELPGRQTLVALCRILPRCREGVRDRRHQRIDAGNRPGNQFSGDRQAYFTAMVTFR
jgi:hypothetical protein